MARKSPRKKSTSANSPTPTVGKVGRRCQICEGRPLKATCACSLNPDGSRRIKHRVRKVREPTLSNTPTSLPLPTAAPPQTWSSPGPIGTSLESNHTDLPELHPAPLPGIGLSLTLNDPQLPATDSDVARSNLSQESPTPPPVLSPYLSSSLDQTIDPFLSGPMISMPNFSSPTSDVNDAFHLDNDSDSDDTSSDDGSNIGVPSTPSRPGGSHLLDFGSLDVTSSPAYRSARKAWNTASHGHQRAPREKKPAVHGFVSGSMQGSLLLKIKRRNALRPAIMDGTHASRRFMREMKFVIERAERVALETGAWVFVGGQQPQSRSNFIHFSSNAMRTHALQETQQLTNQFSTLISDLREARLDSALNAQRTLRATQTAFESFQADVKKAMEDKDRQTEYLVGMVAALQQQIGTGSQSV